MSLRQQQVAVFLGTVLIIFGIFAAGLWLVSQRLTTEATLQTALLMARQVEIALADSLSQRPKAQPQPAQSSFWNFLGNIFPGRKPDSSSAAANRTAEVRGLMRAFIDRSGGIEAMWVLNSEGKILYSSRTNEKNQSPPELDMTESLRHGITTINTARQGNSTYYDVFVPLQMPAGVRGPGGLRLWINQASLTDLLSGMWRQLTLLFVLGGGIALLSAFLTTAIYTRRFRLISDTLRQAEAGTYETRPKYPRQDEVGTSLDLIDRLVMKQRKNTTAPNPVQRLAVAARTLAHEVRTPLNALAIHLEVLRSSSAPTHDEENTKNRHQSSLAAIDAGIRQVDRLVRDFTDYSAPIASERKDLDVYEILNSSIDAVASQCAQRKITVAKNFASRPWYIQGDGPRLRQAFDNLLRNAIEAQPEGGSISVNASKNGNQLRLDFSDSGPGVPLKEQAEIFEFGKTTKAGGSGIGLPLSQLIAEAHGGSLVYQDKNGTSSGATFRMTLPLQELH